LQEFKPQRNVNSEIIDDITFLSNSTYSKKERAVKDIAELIDNGIKEII
jgi:hypothetical protein